MIDRIASAVGDLRSTPALLAIVLLQFATLAVIYFSASANADRVQVRELALIEACKGEQ